MRVLVIVDDVAQQEYLQSLLSAEGYEVRSVLEPQQGLRAAFQFRPHLILLSTTRGNQEIPEICRHLREFYHEPIIIYSESDVVADKVRSLDAGADDYVVVEANGPELLARIRARLRGLNDSVQRERSPYVDQTLYIDLSRKRVLKRGRFVHLTQIEFRLLSYFVQHPTEVIAPRDLLANALGPEYRDDLDYLKVYITRLRQKLEDDPKKPQYLINHRGLGYSFEARA